MFGQGEGSSRIEKIHNEELHNLLSSTDITKVMTSWNIR
jgi:hypothetical protein